MPREYVMMVTCSGCGKTGKESEGFAESALSIGPKQVWAFDFCPDCQNRTELAWLREIGDPVAKSKAPRKAKEKTPPPQVEPARVLAVEEGELIPCDYCDHEGFQSEAGKAQHESRKHGVASRSGKELAERGTGPLKCKVRGCTGGPDGKPFGAKAPQGLAAHARVAHPKQHAAAMKAKQSA